MRFGLNPGNGGPCADPRTMADLAAIAEEAGWDGVFLEDYVVYQNQAGMPTYDPWVCLAAMAMRTTRIRLGTTVTPLPRRRVAKLAAETVALDHLSGGRVTLGVGLGDAWDVALANLGEETNSRARGEMVDEGLEVLVGLWRGASSSPHNSARPARLSLSMVLLASAGMVFVAGMSLSTGTQGVDDERKRPLNA